MEINRYEVCRYLGIRQGEPDARTGDLIDECQAELMKAATPRMVHRTYPLTIRKDGSLDLTCFQVKSKNLKKNLEGCDQIILFAATIGEAVDRLIRRYMKTQVSKGVVMQAVSAAMIEAYCNEVNLDFKRKAAQEGYFLRPRFSPGYGDFPLECQKAIGEALKMEKTCGITLTDSLLMLPSKSVTAVIGMSRQEISCQLEGCEVCSKQNDCPYRRS